jgi:replicative DNA helicase
MRHQQKPFDIIYIDQLSLMNHGRGMSQENRAQLIGQTTRGIKELARKLNVPIVLIHQLNRESDRRANNKATAKKDDDGDAKWDNSRPQLIDLKDSGSIEEDADKVILLHRLREEAEESAVVDMEVNVAKNRGGRIGRAKVLYFLRHQSFENKAR